MSMPIHEDGLMERFEALAAIDVVSTFRPFSQEDLDLLGAYHDAVGGVASRPLFADGIKFSFSSGQNAGPPSLEHAGDDALRSVMIDFRRLWLQKERTHFTKVLTLLREHSEDESATTMLNALGRDFREACRDELMATTDPKDPGKTRLIRARQVINDWLNGGSFHDDVDARERVKRWSPATYEFSLIKAVNRVSNVCLALDVPIVVILTGQERGLACS
jgi:hypothetical protein